jgi:hypothetical protein
VVRFCRNLLENFNALWTFLGRKVILIFSVYCCGIIFLGQEHQLFCSQYRSCVFLPLISLLGDTILKPYFSGMKNQSVQGRIYSVF